MKFCGDLRVDLSTAHITDSEALTMLRTLKLYSLLISSHESRPVCVQSCRPWDPVMYGRRLLKQRLCRHPLRRRARTMLLHVEDCCFQPAYALSWVTKSDVILMLCRLHVREQHIEKQLRTYMPEYGAAHQKSERQQQLHKRM